MATQAESFLSFYERSEKMNGSICFSEYFRETFTNQSPIKYCVKYHNNAEEQLRNISNCILKNLHLNSHFKSLADKYYPIDLFEKFYNLIKDIVIKRNIDENSLPKLLLLLHTSKGNFKTPQFIQIFDSIDSLKILIKTDYLGLKAINTFEIVFQKLLVNNRVKQISSDVIKNISGYAASDYDFSKIKLYYFKVPIPSLNGYAGIDSIYFS